MPAKKKDIAELVKKSRSPKIMPNGITESVTPFDEDDFSSDLAFDLALSAYNELLARGQNFVSATYQIKMYAECMARGYEILMSLGMGTYTVATERSGNKSNPEVRVALDFIDRARQWSTILGLDPKSRSTMPVTLPKLPHEKEDEIKDKTVLSMIKKLG